MSTVDFQLTDQVVVITGGARGIGAACARRLARDGAAIALWDVDDAGGREVATSIVGRGGRAAYLHCDVASRTAVETALAATHAAFGAVTGLVNNAGIFRAAPFLEIREADWDLVLKVNLKGSFLVGQHVARSMVDAGVRGAIVNMSSVNGVMAIPTLASYNASKGAIDQLTRVMSLSLAPHGVRVNAVAPGTIATELARAAVLSDASAQKRILSRTPLGRLGEPDEVADVVAFLLSDASRYMTGEIVYVDGGRLALNYTV